MTIALSDKTDAPSAKTSRSYTKTESPFASIEVPSYKTESPYTKTKGPLRETIPPFCKTQRPSAKTDLVLLAECQCSPNHRRVRIPLLGELRGLCNEIARLGRHEGDHHAITSPAPGMGL